MSTILKINRPGDFISYIGGQTRHPLVGVVDFSKVSPVPSSLNDYGVYALFMHSKVRDDLKYGLGWFGHTSGSLICVSPGQIGGREDSGDLIDIDGWALLFHPDLLVGTPLEKGIREFSFFDYCANEAVFLRDDEKETLASLMKSILAEMALPADSEQDAIIVGYISVMLHVCNRAYTRQFHQIRQTSDDILVRLSALLNEYYDQGRQLRHGVPRVQYFARELGMTTNYFGDMFKKTTGENAGNFIRNHIIRMAKNRLVSSGNVSQVAYDLGFEYPQHFSRMFRRNTGVSPTQYVEEVSAKARPFPAI